MSKVSTADDYHSKCVVEWLKADAECSRTYALWQAAVERRVRLAIKKNEAWGELEMARAEAKAALKKRRSRC
jgi:hypothetical protein